MIQNRSRFRLIYCKNKKFMNFELDYKKGEAANMSKDADNTPTVFYVRTKILAILGGEHECSVCLQTQILL